MWGLVVGGLIVWGGAGCPNTEGSEGGTGGSESPTSPTLFSRLLYFFVPLSPDSRPLLCFSRYHVNHAAWLRILIGRECFGLQSEIKNCVVNRTTPHSPARSLKRHSFDTSLHHAAKSSVFCELQSYGASSQEGLPWTDFSPPHPKIPRPIRMVFDLPRTQMSLFPWKCVRKGRREGGLWLDDIWPDSLCRSYGEFRQLAKQTRHWHDWHSRHTRVRVSYHLIHVLWEGFQFHRK